MTQSNKELWFGSLFRIAGYGLLVISFLDIIASFFPTHLGNPNWEFALVRSLVGDFPGALIGVVLVFVSETNFRLFKLLSRACLVVTVLYLLLVPLGVSSALRIDQDNQRQFVGFTNQRLLPLQQLREQLSKATTAQDLTQFLARLNPQAPPPDITNPQATKKQLLAKLDTTEQNLRNEIAARQTDTRLSVFQQALRMNLEAVICAIVFFALWRNTSRGSRR